MPELTGLRVFSRKSGTMMDQNELSICSERLSLFRSDRPTARQHRHGLNGDKQHQRMHSHGTEASLRRLYWTMRIGIAFI